MCIHIPKIQNKATKTAIYPCPYLPIYLPYITHCMDLQPLWQGNVATLVSKPPNGLLEISERVFVFDRCFTTEIMEGNQFKIYIEGKIGQLQEYIPDASYMALNFCEGDAQIPLGEMLSDYDMTIIDYPLQYENRPVLTVEMISHFLESSESWLSLGQKNVLLMHCGCGGWPVLPFMLASLLINQKQFNVEQRTLNMIYKQAPRELLNLISPLDPLPSQSWCVQYISRWNVSAVWPLVDRTLVLDCIILRVNPDMDGSGGCHPLTATDRSSKLLFSTPKKGKLVQHFKQARCKLVKFDINCHVKGGIVLECITFNDGLKREKMMFRVMFNTAFIRSNTVMVNRGEINILWNVKDRFPKNFRAQIIFSDMDSTSSITTLSLPETGDKAGLPMEAFTKVQEIFFNVDFICSEPDVPLDTIRQLAASNNISERFDVVPSFTRQLLESDLVHKDKILGDGYLQISAEVSSHVVKKLKTISQKGAKEDRVNRGLSVDGIKGMTKSMVIEKYLKPKESESDIRGPSAEIAGAEDMRKYTESESSARSFADVIQEVLSPESLKEPVNAAVTEEMPKTESDRGATSSATEIRDVLFPKSSKETAVIENRTVVGTEEMSKYPESDRGSKSSAAEIQESLDYHHISVEAREEQVGILSPKGAKEAMSIKNINIARTEEISKPLEAERGAGVSTAGVVESQSGPQKCAESRHVFQRSPKGSLSSPTSYCNSLQGSPVPISRYHSAPLVLGISALLNDHFAPEIKGLNSVNLSPKHAVSPNFTNSDIDKPQSPIFAIRRSLPPHLKEIRSEAMIIPQSPETPHSQTSPGRDTPSSPPPLPMLSTFSPKTNDSTPRSLSPSPPPPPPPPPPPYPMLGMKTMSSFMLHENSLATPQLPLSLPHAELATSRICSFSVPVPPPPPSFVKQGAQHATPTPIASAPPPPPPAPISKECIPNITPHCSLAWPSVPEPPPPPQPWLKESMPILTQHSPPVPPPPAPIFLPKSRSASFSSHSSGSSLKIPPPAPPLGDKGRIQPRSTLRSLFQSKKSNLKPYHWLKLTRVVQGSLWAEAQKPEEAFKTPEIDMSELESLFAASLPDSDRGISVGESSRRTLGSKSEKVNLIELRRAYNCEIMLTKVKVPLSELATSILTLDDSALDVDQVENLIKFCPKKEEMEILKNYNGDKENLGKCEQFFLELMKVQRVESKLRVFAFKIQFHSQVSDLRKNLNVINAACEEVKQSVKLKRIMQTILSLGNALNQGTARGSAVGFRLDSLLKLTDTRGRNNKITLMHYLCKVLSEQLPEFLNFPQDLVNLEAATKIQLKYLAEEMQALSKGLEKVIQELTLSEKEGLISHCFCESLKKFVSFAEGEVRSLGSLYADVGRNADALALYFGEDPARVPFEQVVSTLRKFMTMFIRAHDENCKQIELQKKKAQKETDEKARLDPSKDQKMTITLNLQEHLVK